MRVIIVSPDAILNNETITYLNNNEPKAAHNHINKTGLYDKFYAKDKETVILIVPKLANRPYLETHFYNEVLYAGRELYNEKQKTPLTQVFVEDFTDNTTTNIYKSAPKTHHFLYETVNQLAIMFPNETSEIKIEVIASDNRAFNMNGLILPERMTLEITDLTKKEPSVEIKGGGYIDPNYNNEITRRELGDWINQTISTKQHADATALHKARNNSNEKYYNFKEKLEALSKSINECYKSAILLPLFDKIKNLSKTWDQSDDNQTQFFNQALGLLNNMIKRPGLIDAAKLDKVLDESLNLFPLIHKGEKKNIFSSTKDFEMTYENLPKITAVMKNFNELITPPEGITQEQYKIIQNQTNESINDLSKFTKANHLKTAALFSSGSIGILAAAGILFGVLCPPLAMAIPLWVLIIAPLCASVAGIFGTVQMVNGVQKFKDTYKEEGLKMTFFDTAKNTFNKLAPDYNKKLAPSNNKSADTEAEQPEDLAKAAAIL
ncbi:MAG: hypothetical protein Q8M40_06585 [Legionella sp.]|nr:hypothetical protein [Legionella sp.]